MTSNTLCVLPWNHLATHPDGKVTLCCVSSHENNMSAAKTNNKLLNLNTSSINDIINSDYFKQVRIQMLDGEKPLACMRCYQEEDQGIQSKRMLENSRYVINSSTFDGTIKPNLEFVELRLGNLCNVRCRTCNPSSSSQWVVEYDKMQKQLDFVTKYHKISYDWIDSDLFWDQLFDASSNLKVLYINGGEPTLVEKHWGYLERLIEKGLEKNITLWYSINMTRIPSRLLAIWKKFKKVIVHASIDDLYERNEYIRKGTRWSDVEHSISTLQNNNWIETSVTQTISWINIYYIDEFKQYFNQKRIIVNHNIVHDPKYLSPLILPEKIKAVIREDKKHVEEINNLLYGDSNEELFNNGLRYMHWLDKSRGESFCDIFPEWSAIINYSNKG